MPTAPVRCGTWWNWASPLDERVADGFYFGRSLKIVQHLMSHPELLDRPLKEELDLDC